MTTPLKFKAPLGILVQDGDSILLAAEGRPEIIARLKTEFVPEIRQLHTELKTSVPAQASAKADTGELTQEQNRAMEDLKDMLAKARKTAKLAFPGQDVKLRQQFQVGNAGNLRLPLLLQSARIIEASCKAPANLPGMNGNGWTAAETTALHNRIEELDSTDREQEDSKGIGTGATGVRNDLANHLYDGLLKIQNAADLQYPESDPNNAPHRVAQPTCNIRNPIPTTSRIASHSISAPSRRRSNARAKPRKPPQPIRRLRSLNHPYNGKKTRVGPQSPTRVAQPSRLRVPAPSRCEFMKNNNHRPAAGRRHNPQA
jgi:hypothetical protein